MSRSRPVLVYDAHGAPPERWKNRLPAHVEFRVILRWAEVLENYRDARGLVVEVENFREWAHLESLDRLPRDPHITPLVVFTGRDPDSLATLARIPIEKLLWRCLSPDLVAAELQAVFGRQDSVAALRRAAVEGRLNPVLKSLFAEHPPPRTIDEWARRTGWDRRTLWARWKSCFDGRPPIRLQDLVGWSLLLAAVSQKRPGCSWQAVSRTLGLPPRRLTRLAQRLLATDLRGLGAMSKEEVRERFQQAMAGSATDRAKAGQIVRGSSSMH